MRKSLDGRIYMHGSQNYLPLSCLYQSYMNDVDFSILLCLTPDDFTRQRESPRMEKSIIW